MSDQPQVPAGRARGRARARPRTQEEMDSVRMPGVGLAPGPFVTPRSSGVSTPSHGRGSTPDSTGRGRGVTPEREDAARTTPVGAGRGQFARGSITAPPPASTISSEMSSASAGDSVVIPLKDLDLEGGSLTSSKPGSEKGQLTGPTLGRGATRGRRDRMELYPRTKPDTLSSKQGSGGQDLMISTNFFRLVSKPDWRLLKYRVDMTPDIDFTKARKAMVYQHKDTKLKNMVFDGTLLFTDTRLAPNDDVTPVTWTSTRTDGSIVTLTLKMVEELQPTDYHYLQFFNLGESKLKTMKEFLTFFISSGRSSTFKENTKFKFCLEFLHFQL